VRLGRLVRRLRGAAFCLPSFLMVFSAAAPYVELRAAALDSRSVLGIGAAVIAIITRSATNLFARR